MSAGGGIPLLSGPPPAVSDGDESFCRKCNKEFNMLFARSRRCNHCGYLYCHSCTDYQALMPRTGQASAAPTGHDPAPVCAYCIEDLSITAAGKGQLRSMSLHKLKKYAKDYNIDVANVLEKDELINRLLAARGPNGCLPRANENYYRQYSVPKSTVERQRNLFSRARDAMGSTERPTQSNSGAPNTQQAPPYAPRARTTSHPSNFPRPDLNQNQQRQSTPQQPRYQYQQYNPYVANPQSNHHSFPNPYNANLPPRAQPQARAPPRQANLNVPPQNSRPRSASVPRTPGGTSRTTSPTPTIPTLDELLEMSSESIRALSISTLKGILFRNHVQTGMVVEKGELVLKVERLIEDEKQERQAAAERADEEDREMREAIERSKREEEERLARVHAAAAREHENAASTHETGSASGANASEAQTPNADGGPSTPVSEPSAAPATPPPPPGKLSQKAQAMASHLERTGLCVICQDDEANIAIVDCGHLAMCRNCADLIMNSTRECPLCRTRIVTEARLLRIFKS